MSTHDTETGRDQNPMEQRPALIDIQHNGIEQQVQPSQIFNQPSNSQREPKINSLYIFQRSKEVPLWVSVAFLVLLLLFVATDRFYTRFFLPLQEATRGLINLTFLNYCVLFIVIVGGLFFWVAKLKPGDVGLRLPDVLPGIVVTAFGWIMIQLIALVLNLVFFGRVTIDHIWLVPFGTTTMLGAILFGQLLGNALFEEITWRGFMLPQCYFKLTGLQKRARIRIGIALVISQLLFALYHIPVQLSSGVSPLQLPLTLLPIFLIGLLLAFVYLRTGNLFIAVGLHALNDNPTVLFSPTFLSNDLLGLIFVCVFALLLILFWPRFARRLQPQHEYKDVEALAEVDRPAQGDQEGMSA